MITTFFQYTREKYVLSALWSSRLTEWFKRKIVFVQIYEQSHVTQIVPLGHFYWSVTALRLSFLFVCLVVLWVLLQVRTIQTQEPDLTQASTSI